MTVTAPLPSKKDAFDGEALEISEYHITAFILIFSELFFV